MTYLFCAFCMALPPRSELPLDKRLEAAGAWTVLNGYAVCQRHVEFTHGEFTWEERFADAERWEQAVRS